jgi:hypothetical protein
MGLLNWSNSKVKKLSWVDVKLIQISTAAFILMLAKLWEPLLILEWYWYLAGAVLFAIKPTLILFRGKKEYSAPTESE